MLKTTLMISTKAHEVHNSGFRRAASKIVCQLRRATMDLS